MDFAEFAIAYQKRTAQRIADFEAVMQDTQRKMEFAAKQHAIARQNPDRPPLHVPRGEYPIPRADRERLQKAQVRSVLRARGIDPDKV